MRFKRRHNVRFFSRFPPRLPDFYEHEIIFMNIFIKYSCFLTGLVNKITMFIKSEGKIGTLYIIYSF